MSETRDLRQEILVTAKGLFIQQGYHGLAMRQIAEALGVTKAALYYHFKDKEELFLAILNFYLDEMEAMLDEIDSLPVTSKEKIRRVVEGILSQPAEQRSTIRLASQEMAQLSQPVRQAFNLVYHAKFIDRIQAILISGMQTGEFKPLQPEVATWVLLGMMYPYFYPTQSREMPIPAETVEQILAIYLSGIAA